MPKKERAAAEIEPAEYEEVVDGTTDVDRRLRTVEAMLAGLLRSHGEIFAGATALLDQLEANQTAVDDTDNAQRL
jgi:hypothetical protein